ncbi:T-cell surface glycoprotein CD3 epsilon chain-like [Etheostoma cragini]|uniref:T-cell surface glycoprotein CD3 epsilon chain-like n=1 Tax=Etheostoma cragini TaxID=417921 RepID=UPI00155E417F|nr:T-cell surface glycoprotein CD3 epsilon chain-like [Etheostoma cragini]
MNSMGVRATLAVLLLFIATVKAAEGGVEFWRKKFTMTCPESGNWFRKGKEVEAERLEKNQISIQRNYDGNSNDLYYCQFDIEGDGSESKKEKKYYFYVKGKVCGNCFELESFVVGLAIVVDVLGTAFVMMVIYMCTKKKYSAGLSQASKAPARSAGHAPPNPSPYEQLNHRTRTQDHYDLLNRMG